MTRRSREDLEELLGRTSALVEAMVDLCDSLAVGAGRVLDTDAYRALYKMASNPEHEFYKTNPKVCGKLYLSDAVLVQALLEYRKMRKAFDDAKQAISKKSPE